MKKTQLLFFVSLLLLPSLAFAQSSGYFSPLNLQPPDTDLSVSYLENIFGVVDGVLSGSGSQLLGALFGVFNSAILVLGGIVIIYTFFVSTINTAHEGQLLGKKWSSPWIPLRSVIGIALLIPKASGYSFIQIFMMWVIVQGVGAADSIWNAALDYLVRGGVVVQQNTKPSGKLIDGAGELLRSLTCMYMLQVQIQATRGDAPVFYQNVLAAFNNASSGDSVSIDFPNEPVDSTYANLNGICGSISWDTVELPNYMTDDDGTVKPQYVNVQPIIENSRTSAMQTLLTDLYPVAVSIVNNYNNVNSPNSNSMPLGKIIKKNPLIWGSGSASKPGSYLLQGSTLVDAASSYLGIMAPTLNLINNDVNNSKDWIQDAKKEGWILAGKYYFTIVALNDGVAKISESSIPDFDGPKDGLSQNSALQGVLGEDSAELNALDDLVTQDSEYDVGSSSPFIEGATKYGGKVNYGSLETMKSYKSSLPKAVREILNILFSGIASIIGGFFDLMAAQQTNANPIVSLSILGSGLLSLSLTILVKISVAVFAATASLGAAFGFTFSVSMIVLTLSLSSMITPILVSLVVVGLFMVFYLPMIPFIIFLFGAVGWIIAVVEAIIAAPLVAIGIASPEGHEIAGKAAPAIGLLVNVFLRPTLMIFGFLIGMMLAYVSVWLLNRGFSDAFRSLSDGIEGYAWVFFPIGLLILYVLIVMQLLQKSFTLTYIIPDEVLKWIGTHVKGMGGEAEAEQKIAGGFHQAAGKIGEAAGGMVSGAKAGADAYNQAQQQTSNDPNIELGEDGGSSSSALNNATSGGNAAGMTGTGGTQIAGTPPSGGSSGRTGLNPNTPL